VGATGLLGGTPASAVGATADVGIGTTPHVVADPEGNAYLAWTEEDRGAQDVVHACRVPAGTLTCDRRAEWAYPGGDSLSSAIVRDPGTGELHVVIQRGFGPESGTYVASSADEGATFAAPRRIARGQEGGIQDATFGPGAFRLATTTTYAGKSVQVPALSGGETATRAQDLVSADGLDLQIGSPSSTSLLTISRETSTAGALVWRRFDGTGDPNTVAAWGPERRAAGIVADADLATNGLSAPVVAGFEEGVFVVRRYDAGTDSFGVPVPIERDPGAISPFVDLDPASNVHAFHVTDVKAGIPRSGRNLVYHASADGTTWPATGEVLSVGDDVRDLRSAAGTTGRGVAVWRSPLDGGANSRIRIAAIAGPSGFKAPEPDAPGEPVTPSCAKVPRLGIAQLVALEGCFSGTEPKLSITTPFLVNGVKVDPKGKAARLDLKARTLALPTGAVAEMDPIVIAKGERTWTFPASGEYTIPGVHDLDKAGYGASLLGLDVVGDARVVFTKDASRMAAHMRLPKPFQTVNGDVTFRANNAVGLRLDGLVIRAGKSPDKLPFGFHDLEFAYVADPPTWRGKVQWTPPVGSGDTYGGEIEVVDGSLAFLRIFGRFALPGKQLYPPTIFLPFAGLQLRTSPLELQGQLIITGGPPTPVAPVSVGRYDKAGPPEETYGTLTFTLASPFRFEALGPVYVFGSKLGTGYLRYTYPLDLAFGADAQVGQCDPATGQTKLGARANFDGYITASKSFAFSLSAKATICFLGLTPSGEAVLSSKGIAGCAEVSLAEPIPSTISAGAGLFWSDPGDVTFMWDGCETEQYAIPAPGGARAAQAGDGFAVEPGLKQLNVRLEGAPGRPPRAALVAPDGRRYEPPAEGEPGVRAPSHLAYANAADGTLVYALGPPAPGRWRVEPLPGSTPVARVQLARDAPPPRISARVERRTRAGGRRVLTWRRTDPAVGETATLVAQGRGTLQRLGTIRAGQTAGRLAFTPRRGPGGRRTIFAVVERGGLPAARLRVATFVAQGPRRAGRAGRLKATRRATTIRVSWRPAAGATRQEIHVRLSDGTAFLREVGPRTRTLRERGVRRGVTGTVTVRALGYDGRPGATRRVAVPGRERPGRRRGR
jgi:hypothetical protein